MVARRVQGLIELRPVAAISFIRMFFALIVALSLCISVATFVNNVN